MWPLSLRSVLLSLGSLSSLLRLSLLLLLLDLCLGPLPSFLRLRSIWLHLRWALWSLPSRLRLRAILLHLRLPLWSLPSRLRWRLWRLDLRLGPLPAFLRLRAIWLLPLLSECLSLGFRSRLIVLDAPRALPFPVAIIVPTLPVPL